MRIEIVSGWSTSRTYRTQRGCFYGVAIGPESDEGQCRVNGVLLQAGRVLALRTDGLNGYAIERTIATPGDNDGDDLDTMNSVKHLELMLFECPEELTCEVARPNGSYSAKGVAVTNAAFTRVLVAPYNGRRQARITARSVAGAGDQALGYQLVGRYWSRSRRAVVERILETVEPVALGDSEIVLVFGGHDEAEIYDEIALELKIIGASGTANADIETIGELGCR